MISVPSDAEGRAWTAARPRDRKVEQNALVTLVTAEDDGTISVLGTAFVIYGHEDNAICLAAGHSFESVKQRQQTRAGRNFLSMPPDFRPTGPEYVKMEGEVFAFVAVNGEGHALV